MKLLEYNLLKEILQLLPMLNYATNPGASSMT